MQPNFTKLPISWIWQSNSMKSQTLMSNKFLECCWNLEKSINLQITLTTKKTKNYTHGWDNTINPLETYKKLTDIMKKENQLLI